MGIVTVTTAFFLLRRDMKRGNIQQGEAVAIAENEVQSHLLTKRMKVTFAFLIPILFGLDVVAMYYFQLQGGDATALIGGTAIFILSLLSVVAYKEKSLEQITDLFIQGFQFGFKVFGPVIPIAAFFYLGDSGFQTIIGDFLPKQSHGIVNDLGVALSNIVPLSKEVGVVTLVGVGAITGLDGSGFSGISLVGSIAKLFAAAIGTGIATLTALGQIAAIWVGGGTLVPWALIPAAAICGVSPFELARRNVVPVITGLIATTIVAMFLI